MASAAGVPQYSPSRPQRRITQYPPLLLGKHPRKDAFLATYGQTFVMLAAPRERQGCGDRHSELAQLPGFGRG